MSAESMSVNSDVPAAVIAISHDGHWAHAYEDVPAAAAERGFGGPGFAGTGVDFFDATGRRLIPEFGPQGALQNLRPAAGEAPVPEQVRDRLCTVIAYVDAAIGQGRPAVIAHLTKAGLSTDQARSRLPRLDGTDLAEALRRARPLLGPHPMDPDHQHSAGTLHNLIVHGGNP